MLIFTYYTKHIAQKFYPMLLCSSLYLTIVLKVSGIISWYFASHMYVTMHHDLIIIICTIQKHQIFSYRWLTIFQCCKTTRVHFRACASPKDINRTENCMWCQTVLYSLCHILKAQYFKYTRAQRQCHKCMLLCLHST